jgi:hypothetical protein
MPTPESAPKFTLDEDFWSRCDAFLTEELSGRVEKRAETLTNLLIRLYYEIEQLTEELQQTNIGLQQIQEFKSIPLIDDPIKSILNIEQAHTEERLAKAKAILQEVTALHSHMYQVNTTLRDYLNESIG